MLGNMNTEDYKPAMPFINLRNFTDSLYEL